MSFTQSFPNDSSHENKQLYQFFLLMDHTFWAREICAALSTLLKQCIIRIKDALTNQLKPFFSQPALINAFLIMEFNTELLLPAINLYIL